MPVPDQNYELLTREEAAGIASCTVRYIELRRKAGDGPPIVRLGKRKVRFERSAFVAWLKAHRSDEPTNTAAAIAA